MDTNINKEVLFSDNEGNSLWCVREYDMRSIDDFDSLQLLTEPEVRVYGKIMKQRRCVGFYSDSSVGYKYSGQIMPSLPLTTPDSGSSVELVKNIMERVNSDLSLEYNGVLVNLYRTGEDYISAHGDSESGLSRGSVVSIAYGATRKFKIYEGTKCVISIEHEPGMLLCMEGERFQRKYKHCIPVQKKVKDSRLSLTFRTHKV